MPITRISDLVSDWGGFEELVAELNATGNLSVERNVILKGKSGVPRQIDVVVKHRQGLYEHLILIECKHLKRPVSRAAVDAFASAVLDTGASKGVIFSLKGFQKGAKNLAKNTNIDLFSVRDVTIRGARYVQCISQICQYALLGVVSFATRGSEELELRWTVENVNGQPKDGEPLEVMGIESPHEFDLAGVLFDLFKELHERQAKLINPDHKGFLRYIGFSEVARSHVVNDRNEPLVAAKLRVELGVTILQEHFFIDRLRDLSFVLAVEDCVRREYRVISKKTSNLKFLLPSPSKPEKYGISHAPADEVYESKIIFAVALPEVVLPSGFDGLTPYQIAYEI